MTRVAFAEAAEAEAEEARHYYEAISPALAVAFNEALAHAVARVTESPLMWPPLNRRIRRYLFDRFPYALIYRAEGEFIYVLTVMHQRRRPGYWRGR